MTTDAVGGVFFYTTTLVRALCAAGHSVTLVVQGPAANESKRAALREIDGVDIVETDLDVEWRDADGRDTARAHRELLRIADRVRPDVVHLNGYREALAGFAAPVVITAHSCVGTWWRACRGGEPDATWDRYTRDVQAGLNAADAWIAPSRTFCGMIEELYAPRTRGDVVHNGIAPLVPGTSERAVAFSVGRMWDEAKDLATLVRAAEKVSCPVEIAGPLQAPGGGDLPESGAAPCLGEVAYPDVLRRMADAAVFVSSAVYEPFGLSVLEAAASGCALVLADIPSFRELWDDAALFFAPRDAADLARQINRLIGDDRLRANLRARAIERAGRYDAARTVQGTCDVYEKVLNAPRAPVRVADAARLSA